MPYIVLAAALTRTKERCQAEASDDVFLTELLEMSAGKDAAGTVHFRPFFVAAKFLEQNPDLRDLSEGDGAKFTLAQPRIESLLNLQHQYDVANGLDVPPGMSAIATNAVIKTRAIATASLPTRSVL